MLFLSHQVLSRRVMTALQVVTQIAAISGVGIGLVGAVLGFINTWHQLSKDAVRLKVTPASAHTLWRDGSVSPEKLSIEVVNLSTFPVTVKEVGLECITKEGRNGRLVDLSSTTNRGPLPVRLEPREALTVLWKGNPKAEPRLAEVRAAYACCQCGTVRYGSSPRLKQLIREAKKRQCSGVPT